MADARAVPVLSARDLAHEAGYARYEALEDLIVRQVRSLTAAAADDPIPTDVTYAALGLTSARLAQLRQRLEQQLDLDIEAATLFDCATVDALVAHLDGVISGLVGTR